MSQKNTRPILGLVRELLIVVAGILIAFSLNNWAEGLKEKKIQKEYLRSLISDLDKDLILLQTNLDSINGLKNKAAQLTQHVFQPGLPGRAQAALDGFAKLTQAPYFYPNSASYQTLTNSGDLKYIHDLELRNKIVDHYKKYEVLDGENYRSRVFMESSVIPYYMEQTDFRKVFTMKGEEYFDDPRFTNILLAYSGIFYIVAIRYEEAIERCKALKESIELELS